MAKTEATEMRIPVASAVVVNVVDPGSAGSEGPLGEQALGLEERLQRLTVHGAEDARELRAMPREAFLERVELPVAGMRRRPCIVHRRST